MLKLQAKVLPSELTNTIDQFIVYGHRNEAHFTYIYVYIIPMSAFTKKNFPKCNFTYIFCYFDFALGLHPWLWWLLERSQIPSCPRQLQTCARLMQGWVASAGCPPKQKNTGHAGDTCQVARNVRESPEMEEDLQVSRKCYKISRNLVNFIGKWFLRKTCEFLAYLSKMCVSTHEYHWMWNIIQAGLFRYHTG